MRMKSEKTLLILRDWFLVNSSYLLKDAFGLDDVIYEIDIGFRSWRFRLYEGDSKVKYNYWVVKSQDSISHVSGCKVKDGIG